MASIRPKGLSSDLLNADAELGDEDPVLFYPKISENQFSLPIAQQSFFFLIVL
jgi:hypothetical protein